jgi:hypothetical protein
MIRFFSELKKRNRLLSNFGWLCMLGAVACTILYQFDKTLVLNINAWIKPLKFFLSSGIFAWTIAWFLYYLDAQRKVRIYSWMVVIVFTFELSVICWQAANGRLSHFNITTPLYMWLFNLMGIAIVTFAVWTLYMGILFFTQKHFTISKTYLWGIRIGIIAFVLFSFEGGIMAQKLAHTVGSVDGSPGVPLFNWSRTHGDLRVAHFFGIHSLQLLPLAGYWICTKSWQIFLFSFLYISFVSVMLVQALYQVPFIS